MYSLGHALVLLDTRRSHPRGTRGDSRGSIGGDRAMHAGALGWSWSQGAEGKLIVTRL